MKYINHILNALLLTAFAFFALASFSAFAEDGGSSFGDAIVGVIDAVKVGGFAAILAAVIQVLKLDAVGGLINKINPKILPILIHTGTAILNVIAAIASGKPIIPATVEGVFISGTAMSLYDTVIKPRVK